MKRNSKLSLALHALGHMALRAAPMTSEQIAAQNGTNPVVVRRVLGLLRDGGLVRSEKGHAGGWSLARAADDIKVSDVYLAIGERFLAPASRGAENPPHCAIERTLHATVDDALAEAELLLVERLSGPSIRTLADAMGEGRGP
jgi:Rrf2 family protein